VGHIRALGPTTPVNGGSAPYMGHKGAFDGMTSPSALL
jgi:hypothetical protein